MEGSLAENCDDISDKKIAVERKGKSKQIEQLKSELELDRDFCQTNETRKNVTISQNRADVIKSVGSDGKVFVFEDPAKRKQREVCITRSYPRPKLEVILVLLFKCAIFCMCTWSWAIDGLRKHAHPLMYMNTNCWFNPSIRPAICKITSSSIG